LCNAAQVSNKALNQGHGVGVAGQACGETTPRVHPVIPGSWDWKTIMLVRLRGLENVPRRAVEGISQDYGKWASHADFLWLLDRGETGLALNQSILLCFSAYALQHFSA